LSIEFQDTLGSILVKVFSVPKQATVKTALEIMVTHDIGCLVVVERQRGIGIMTERDIMKLILSDPTLLNRKVETVMSKPLITAGEETPVWDAFRIMLRHKIRRLPIEKNGKLVGIVSERDLFRWVMQVVYEQNTPEDIREIVQKGYPR
jgi:CBS domain-containing protein